jgi:hypothetical protein
MKPLTHMARGRGPLDPRFRGDDTQFKGNMAL